MGTWETWYVLEDGSFADPQDVSPGKDGRLRHKDGRAVAYAPHGPRSRGVDPAEERRMAKKVETPVKAKEAPAASNREMKAAEDKKTYETRNYRR